MFPNKSFSSIPVEVYSGVTNTRKMNTGWSNGTKHSNSGLINEVMKYTLVVFATYLTWSL